MTLECGTPTLKSLKRKYIRCSTQATITHLKKYLALKLFKDIEKYKEVRGIGDIFRLVHRKCTTEFLYRLGGAGDPLQEHV